MDAKTLLIAGGACVGIITGLCAKQAWDVYIKDIGYKSRNGIPAMAFTCEETHKPLYDAYDKVAKILLDAGVKYWAIAGTALGALRHNGIIPWDDDIDIGISENSMETALDALKYNNHTVKHHWWGTKVDGLIDIFPIGADGKYAKEMARRKWPKEMFVKDELQSLSMHPFGPTFILVVNGTETYLARFLGESWKTHCCIKPPHVFNSVWSVVWRMNPLIKKDFDIAK